MRSAERPRAGLKAILLLAATACLFWYPTLAGGKVPVAAVYQQHMPPFSDRSSPPPRAWDALLWDSMAQFYPWRMLLHRGLLHDELPLWNPHQYCGYPFVGNGQSALFYPPNWLLRIMSTGRFLGVSLALHWFLAGLLTFWLARTLGLRTPAALFAGIVYQNSGFMIAWAELPTVINVMAWLPGAWLGVELLFRRHRYGLAVMAVSLGLALLAGHLQFAAYVWLSAALYVLVRTVYRWATRRPAPLAKLSLAVLLGLGLGAPQLLPAWELGLNSPRGGEQVSAKGWEFQQQRALQPIELATFVWPEARGDPVTGEYPGLSFTEHCGFAGVLTLVLAGLGLVRRRDRWVGFYALGALAALSVAMAGPLAYLLYFYVPGIGLTGGLSRILGVYTLCVAILGAMGLEVVLRSVARSVRAKRILAVPLVAGAAMVLLLVEVVPWGWHFLPLSPPEQVYADTPLTRALAEKISPGERCLVITPRKAWSLFKLPPALLPPNADTVYGWESPQGYDSLALNAYREFARRWEGADISPVENGNMMLLEHPSRPLLDGASVRWVASMSPLSWPGLALQDHIQGVHIYRNDNALPRVRTAPGYDPSAHLEIRRSTYNTLGAKVDFEGGRITIADVFYPGWQAYVDGKAAEIELDKEVFRQVKVPPGNHTLFLAYYPATVVAGLFLALLSLALLGGICLFEADHEPRDTAAS